MKYIRTKVGILPVEVTKITEPMFIEGLGELICYWGYRKDGAYIFGEVLIKDFIKQSEKLEELCDAFIVLGYNNRKFIYSYKKFVKRVERNHTHCGEHDEYEDRLTYLLKYNEVYGALWVIGDSGEPILKPVIKLNKKNGWELLKL